MVHERKSVTNRSCNTINYLQDVFDRMEDIWVNLPPKIIHKLYKALPGKMQQLIRTRGYSSMRKEDVSRKKRSEIE